MWTSLSTHQGRGKGSRGHGHTRRGHAKKRAKLSDAAAASAPLSPPRAQTVASGAQHSTAAVPTTPPSIKPSVSDSPGGRLRTPSPVARETSGAFVATPDSVMRETREARVSGHSNSTQHPNHTTLTQLLVFILVEGSSWIV